MKRAAGNPGRRALPAADAAEGAAAATKLKPPVRLVAGAVAIWDDLAPELQRLNFLRGTDRHAFARYCQTLAEYWTITRNLQRNGRTYKVESAHGTYQRLRPEFLMQDRLFKRLTDLEDRFGLSPAARQAILARLANLQPTLPGFGQPPDPAQPQQGAPAAPDPGPIGMLGATRH